ncbi:MAG: S1 RNA-binding domain-containing protein, partial [Bacteroidota bacterium]
MAEENKDAEKKAEEVKNEAQESAQDAVENAAEEIQETAEEAKEEVAEAAEEVVEEATEAVEEVTEEVEEVAEEVAEVAEEAPEVVAEAAAEEDEDEGELDLTPPQEEFNWDNYESGQDEYSHEERQRLGDVYGSTLNLIQEKEVVDGTVVSVGKKEIVVNIGYKSEGVIPASEFRYNPELAPGDAVPVYIEKQEDKNGQLIVSHKTARIHSAWDNVNKALEKEEIIKGEVKCRTKGGLIVDVFGIEAFLPGSQIDVKPIRDYDQYVGKLMEFKVVKINQEFKNVVVSHKALIEAELEEQKKQIIGGLEKGQVLEGIVKNITSYGVFVDLGG